MKKRPETYLLFVIHPCSNSKWQIIEANKMLICQSETTANSGTASPDNVVYCSLHGTQLGFRNWAELREVAKCGDSVHSRYSVDSRYVV